jgi:hypothetical protein
MPKAALEAYFRQTGRRVEMRRINKNIVFANGKQGKEITHEVKLNLSISTRYGSFLLKNLKLCISEEVSEILLGDMTLRAMGIDPDTQLEELVRGGVTQLDMEGIQNFEIGNEIELKKLIVRIIKMGEEDNQYVDQESGDLGDMDWNEIEECLENSVKKAVKNGMSKDMGRKLRKLLFKYKDVFRLKLGTDAPIRVEPAKYELKAGVEAVRCKPRYYRHDEKAFMEDMIRMLEKHGLIYMNLNAKWASPVLIVKRPEGGFRLVCDLRRVNEKCQPVVWPMPNLETISEKFKNAKIFFCIDAHKGYWGIPLAKESQEIFSIMTDRAVYTPRRTLQGALNSAAHFQSRMTKIFEDLIEKYMTCWIDDLLGFADSEEELLERLTQVLQRCSDYNVKINPKKCTWFARQIKWCGKIYDGKGVRHDPERVTALANMGHPQTMKDLHQFLYATNWMRQSIINYSFIIQPMSRLIEEMSKRLREAGIKNENAIRISEEEWMRIRESFNNIKIALLNHVTLNYPREGFVRCVFPDASQHAWSMVVTQIPEEDVGKPVKDQRHEPLAFYGKKWTNTEKNWKIIELEAAAIMRGLARGAFLFQTGEQFLLWTDHRNLRYIFETSDLKSHKRQKLERWALELQSYNYKIQHIKGEDNVWADLLSRWGAAGEVALKSRRTVLLVRDMTIDEARVTPFQSTEFAWPNEIDLRKSQLALTMKEKQGALLDPIDKLWKQNKKIIIPQEDEDMKIRLYVIAHAGAAGHFRQYATVKQLKENFIWDKMEENVKSLIEQCLHCVAVPGGLKEPRPWGDTLRAREPYEVLIMDFFFVEAVKTGCPHNFKYILVLKDEFSGFLRFYPCSEQAVE